VQAGYGYKVNSLVENDQYFYHPDHLGSTSIITDKEGVATQFIAYMPFGESLVDEHSSRREQPYKFSGKEIDEETGLSYFGARYYDSQVAVWYGIDPLVEKYSNVGGYVYCNNSPTIMIDPDGKDHYYSDDGVYLGKDKKETENVWVANKYEKLEQGGYSIFDKTQIMDNKGNSMSHEDFKTLAGTLYAEGSSTWQEAAGIYSVMENRGNAEDKTTSEVASGGGIYGYAKRDKISDITANKDNVQNAYKGLIRGALDSKDYSGGGYYWHGRDFAKHTKGSVAHESFYLVGFQFTDSSHDLWNLGNKKSGNKKWNFKYESTGAAGKTTFMKLTSNWQISTGGKKWNGKTK
jgi:RHS repeat-associated protein